VASEIILDATKRVKAKKPLIVSMGDVAGSGGYYVACGSDTIFADECTITGSIGVVAGKLATREMFGKVGITWKEYSRGANAALLSSSNAFTDVERKKLQGWMDDIYGVFKLHVTTIRGSRLKKPIDDLAGGRVYTGKQALDLGLIDKLGTLDDAVKFAAKEAKLDKYELRVVPEPKSFIEQILESSEGKDEDTVRLAAAPFQTGASASLLDSARPPPQRRGPAGTGAARHPQPRRRRVDDAGGAGALGNGLVPRPEGPAVNSPDCKVGYPKNTTSSVGPKGRHLALVVPALRALRSNNTSLPPT
jgi:protease-4